MNLEIIGKVVQLGQLQTGEGRNGTWVKQEFDKVGNSTSAPSTSTSSNEPPYNQDYTQQNSVEDDLPF